MIRSVFIVLVLVFALANTQDCRKQCRAYRKSPVCASNGLTFRNQCMLEKWACLNELQDTLTVVASGPCAKPSAISKQFKNGGSSDSGSEEDSGSSEEQDATDPRPSPSANPRVTTGLPGPMATTTFRPAALETRPPATDDIEVTEYVDMFTTDATSTHKSQTEAPTGTTPCNMTCPLILDIVCGTDGITYQSPCVLEAEACRNGDPTIEVAYAGPCVTPSPTSDEPLVAP